MRVQDATTYASFDGFVIEVSGLSGGGNIKRIALVALERVGLADTGAGELMFMVKTRKGGFGLAVSPARRAEWQTLVDAINEALARQPKS